MKAVIHKYNNMEISINTASFTDRHRKEFFILPCLLASKTNFSNRKHFSIAFLWLIWGISIELKWEKNEQY